jgi:hypothetical protein
MKFRWVIILLPRKKSVGLIIDFGERKVEVKRKIMYFDEDLQDEF